MTNEEAVKRIVEHMAIHKMNEPRAIDISTALQMAIYSLEKQIPSDELASHSESDILKECVNLMHELVDDFSKWYEWVHGENAIAELDEEERFCVRKSYFEIVQQLFLYHTKHSGGGSTCDKCRELGIKDWSENIEFGFEVEEDE